MIISIDFDDTYTADQMLFDALITLAEQRGHLVYVVTSRRDTEDNREIVRVACLPAHRHIFTGMVAKRWFCEQRGIEIDVWCDDNPEAITQGV